MARYGITGQTLHNYRLTGKIKYVKLSERKFMYYPMDDTTETNRSESNTTYVVSNYINGQIVTKVVDEDELRRSLRLKDDKIN